MNQKPISMVINETRLSLVDICNKSNLPYCILESMLKDLYDEVRHLAKVQLKQDEENYNKQIDAQNENVEQITE